MDVLAGGIADAWRLLISGDEQTWQITLLTLRVSATATLIAVILGVPLGALLTLRRFPGRRLALATANTGMGMPPVVIGLLVTVLLWRSGPLGSFGLLYSTPAMVIAQAVIATRPGRGQRIQRRVTHGNHEVAVNAALERKARQSSYESQQRTSTGRWSDPASIRTSAWICSPCGATQ